MHRLLSALNIPSHYICNQRTKASGVEALMILLRRLVYPNRWCDLVDVFGRSESQLRLICNKVLYRCHKFQEMLPTLLIKPIIKCILLDFGRSS